MAGIVAFAMLIVACVLTVPVSAARVIKSSLKYASDDGLGNYQIYLVDDGESLYGVDITSVKYIDITISNNAKEGEWVGGMIITQCDANTWNQIGQFSSTSKEELDKEGIAENYLWCGVGIGEPTTLSFEAPDEFGANTESSSFVILTIQSYAVEGIEINVDNVVLRDASGEVLADLSEESKEDASTAVGGITFQTSNWAHRDTLNQPGLYEAVDLNSEDHQSIVKEIPDYSAIDAEITGDGQYTANVKFGAMEDGKDGDAEYWNLLSLRTSIKAYDFPSLQITIDKLTVDGREVTLNGTPEVVPCKFYEQNSEFNNAAVVKPGINYWGVEIYNTWNSDYKFISSSEDFGHDVSISFTVSGMDKEDDPVITEETTVPATNPPAPVTEPEEDVTEAATSAPVTEPEITTALESGIPQIEGEDGKTGWDVIADEIEKAEDGDDVVVDMNGASELPADVIKNATGKDIKIVLNLGGITWEINGKDINSAADLKNINMSVTKNTENIPSGIVAEVSGDNKNMQISLGHDGEFGFKASMNIDVGEENNGKYANLFYFNPVTKKLEYVSNYNVSKGIARFDFLHASDYVIVFSDTPLIDSPETSETTAAESNDNNGGNPATGFIVAIVPALVAAGGVIVAKRKNK